MLCRSTALSSGLNELTLRLASCFTASVFSLWWLNSLKYCKTQYQTLILNCNIIRIRLISPYLNSFIIYLPSYCSKSVWRSHVKWDVRGKIMILTNVVTVYLTLDLFPFSMGTAFWLFIQFHHVIGSCGIYCWLIMEAIFAK